MKGILNLLDRLLVETRAVVTAEFIVAVPLLFGAFVIAFELSRALWAFDVMTTDVQGGVRYLAHTPMAASDITTAITLVKTGSTTGTVARPPWNWSPSAISNNCTTGTPSASAICVSSSTVSSGFNTSVTVITMSAAIPITLPFLSYINQLTGSHGTVLAYTLRVSDQYTCLAGAATPCGTF